MTVGAKEIALPTEAILVLIILNGTSMLYFHLFTGALPTLHVRSKRKQFDQMSVYGRRKGLRDVRRLLKLKETQYNVPASRLTGFLIQQVRFTRFVDSCIMIS